MIHTSKKRTLEDHLQIDEENAEKRSKPLAKNISSSGCVGCGHCKITDPKKGPTPGPNCLRSRQFKGSTNGFASEASTESRKQRISAFAGADGELARIDGLRKSKMEETRFFFLEDEGIREGDRILDSLVKEKGVDINGMNGREGKCKSSPGKQMCKPRCLGVHGGSVILCHMNSKL